MLVRVEAPGFVAGLVLDERERCVHAAPIIRWAVGLDRVALREEFQRRAWRATVVVDGGTPRHPLLRVPEVADGAVTP